SAIRTVSLTLDKLTDFNTYTVALSGAEIMAFYESYEFQSGGLFFGVLCTSAILNEKYRNRFGLAMDNFTIVETEIPENYVPAADLPGVDILEYNLAECFGENLYSIIENSNFEDEIPESWGTLPDGVTIKTASAGDEIYGEKYLNLNAEKGTAKLVIPFKLTVNKNYVFGISTRADAEDQFRVFVSASPNGSPLTDVDFAEQQFVVAPKDEDGSIKRQGIRIRNTMKSNVQQYLIFEVTKGSVDFDEITLTDKTVTDINRNYYEKKGTEIITVFDLSTLTEKKVEIPANKTVFDVVK
ncbi:MAG: hypothetical protein J5662_00010, partial [Clostridia bacterium]|nr:hypothetical protein [Clostridia bacterium]